MQAASQAQPLVSCIMPTADRRPFIARAVQYFLRQDYPHKELVVVDDGADAIADLLPADDARIRYFRLPQKLTVGAKRNFACEQARGEIIAHWDDDDWHAAYRLSYQVACLQESGADIGGISRLLFYDPARAQAWEYIYPAGQKPWLSGSTLVYRRALWERRPFGNHNVGEDARFIWAQPPLDLSVHTDNEFHVGIIHARNVSRKQTRTPYWRALPTERVQNIMGADWELYAPPAAVADTPAVVAHEIRTVDCAASKTRSALVTAAAGIGDILRVSPLIKILSRLGYEVDVLLAPDYAEVGALFAGAPEIRRLYIGEPMRGARGQSLPAEVSAENYEVATFTLWSAPLRHRVRAARKFDFARRQWLSEGDHACVATIARELGWTEAIPAPLIVVPEVEYDLPSGTIALHPGCKPDWHWKKWHGFGELAAQLPNVAIIGTPSDADNARTYFRAPFEWVSHARDYTGRLGLPAVAALLKHCAALVSNDSGMMHLGVAVGIPTFGVFGITSPQREALPAPNMFAISKGLDCEPACRRQAWGRSNCARHLACLKTLTPAEVLARVREHLPDLQARATPPTTPTTHTQSKVMDEIKLTYHANVFDASGYGQAARAYIHALHRAGITLAVKNLARHAPQVGDKLVESLLDKSLEPDFHLFHGIPAQWAAQAFRLKNAIGMTVWETDVMPTQWRAALNHTLEVWLPCEYNVEVFRRALEKPVFKLPHPVFPSELNGNGSNILASTEITESDFVFYSIFAWQERKSPEQLLRAFMHAFDGEPAAVLVIKSDGGTQTAAQQLLERIRRETGSRARVVLHCEHWEEARIAALHARGNCYLSLHRSEGWGYPLFEAARRGTPVVATNFAGPLEYLNERDHSLVNYQLGAVRQPYVYYHPRMKWAEPDMAHASAMMRRVYAERDDAKARAVRAADELCRNYSLEAVGQAAKERLQQLLQRQRAGATNGAPTAHSNSRPVEALTPPVPIPAEWYDADYFEHAIKSNWQGGYSWANFGSLFQATARFLTEMFDAAESFLDVGCAKGFLVRALRERGKDCHGFDFSSWAITHAEKIAAPYLRQENVETIGYERKFDILLALSVLEKLTETQATEFLARARAWTNQALFAIIPSFQDERAERRYNRAQDGDLAHISMHTRRWWHEKFVAAGWRQDPLHRIAERVCQQHELPRRMNWQVYVYAPA